MQKRVIICDLDGTLIYENLENIFVKFLLSKKKIKYKILFVSLFTLPINIIRNKFYYPSIFKSWTYVLKNKFEDYKEEFFKHNIIHFNDKVISLINSLDADEVILLTGSYQDLATELLENKGITLFNEVIGTKTEKNYFKISRHPYGKGKVKYVNQSNYNIGIANEYSDHFYLDLCNEKYYINLEK